MYLKISDQTDVDAAFDIFHRFESNVRYYCREFPALLTKASGSVMSSAANVDYIDFFMGAGALNYGHNCAALKQPLLQYIADDGITHSLDFYSEAKKSFIETFQNLILKPRGLSYKLQFTGPTGTNAVEAALKLARKVTGRSNVIAFSNAFHGMSLGSLAATASPQKRGGAGVELHNVTFMPYDGYLGDGVDTVQYIKAMLSNGSGTEAPAAFIIETIQGEGGLQHAGMEWMRRLAALARELGALLIIDDIQSGCGRSGKFFSFEDLRVQPDIVCLSKSISGYGLPCSLNLIRPEHDAWLPGEHNGTFRGNNLAFITGNAALKAFWSDGTFESALRAKIDYLHGRLARLAARISGAVPQASVKGRGFMCGLSVDDGALAQAISGEAFRLGLIVETCGVHGQVVKLLPALNIEDHVLARGLDLLETACDNVLHTHSRRLCDVLASA